MIGFLTGKIISKKPTQIILDVGGVGYVLNISISTFEKLGDEGDVVSLFTHLAVKEDALDLYGFFNQSEKDMFKSLISVSGVGPKSAQSIFSGIEIEELKEAIKTGNITRITSIPSIGRKTAERLIVELRDKVDSISVGVEFSATCTSSIRNDAVSALTNLGYNAKLCEKIIRDILTASPNISIEELIKEALAGLSK
jgi:Holliday junction DNA helicase RuvA